MAGLKVQIDTMEAIKGMDAIVEKANAAKTAVRELDRAIARLSATRTDFNKHLGSNVDVVA